LLKRSIIFFLPFIILVSLTGCSLQTPFIKKNISYDTPVKSPTVQTPSLNLVYPNEIESDSIVHISSLDSVFLFGNVTHPGGELIIGAEKISIHNSGAWLAWVGFEEVTELSGDSLFDKRPAGKISIKYHPPSTAQANGTSIERNLWFLMPPTGIEYAKPELLPQNARLEVIEEPAPIRCGWPGTYDLFPLKGTQLWSDGFKDLGRRFYRVILGDGEIGWIEDKYVSVDTLGSPPANSIIHFVTSTVKDRSTEIRLPLNGDLPPYRVERTADDKLELTLYGAMSWTDVIIQPADSRVVREVRWRQIDPDTYRLTAFIRPEWMWGWDVSIDKTGAFIWSIKEAPEIKRNPLKGLTILIDPGHGGTNVGAISPTGADEKQVTLALAEVVKPELERAGAKVIMTRNSDISVGLGERIALALDNQADIVISLHYNALPQGKNPFNHHGTSVHYNHKHSLEFAGTVLKNINTAVGWKGNGLRYQDLAIPRLTFCPSILIENGFLLHPNEDTYAQNEESRKVVARGIKAGIKQWLKDLRKRQESSQTN